MGTPWQSTGGRGLEKTLPDEVQDSHTRGNPGRNHYSPAKSRNVIVHEKDTADILIETKFPDYYNYIYQSKNKVHYQELWKKRRVYSDA